MIRLLYGSDTKRLGARLRALKQKFLQQHDPLNLVEAAAATLTPTELTTHVLGASFWGGARLVAVENALLEGSDELRTTLAAILARVPAETELLLVERGEPDRRSALWKKLQKIAVLEPFTALANPLALREYLNAQAQLFSVRLTPEAARRLIFCVGADTWALENALKTLASAASSGTIDEALVATYVPSPLPDNIFLLLDALFAAAGPSAAEAGEAVVTHYNALLSHGHSPLEIFNLIVGQTRKLVIVKEGLEAGQAPATIAVHGGFNPYVAQKLALPARRFGWPLITRLYQGLANVDVKIKTGEIEDELGVALFLAQWCVMAR